MHPTSTYVHCHLPPPARTVDEKVHAQNGYEQSGYAEEKGVMVVNFPEETNFPVVVEEVYDCTTE